MTPKKTSTRKAKQSKALTRPSHSALAEASARLEFINSMAPGRKPPVIRNLSDDDQRNLTRNNMTGSVTSQAKAMPSSIHKSSRQQPQNRTDSMQLSAQRRQEPEPARRRHRPIVYDSEDEDRESLESSSSMSGTRNRERRNDMLHLRTSLEDCSSSAGGLYDRDRDQRAKLRSPSERQAIMITPGPTSTNTWGQTYSSQLSQYTPYNGRVSASTHAIRPPTASVQTAGQGRAMLQPISQQLPYSSLYKEFDNGIPSDANPIRTEGHWIHAGCDMALPSIEDEDVNHERHCLRMQRRN